MENIVLKVNGMSCSHCENAVKKAVGTMDGVDKVTVSLEDKVVVVDYDNSIVSLDKIKEEIEDQGYEVE
ncbi:copper chaperone CopZ [Mobilitalea sibirica]|uniref:Copper chaperone CopZ n=1 Tax=Mobilitalea sibirica TaxID=1462919 RepID=A0A8J7GXV6_9FIRM|nr:copper chaperone CopZ [Mobilitalea sibirica]MBH1940149.1 copper chaperone CopZ [Mobilitalea sibirica]